MPGIDEAWVRQRAHEIWETEGRPQGRDFDHWCAATEEFRALTPVSPAAQPAAANTLAEVTNGGAIAQPALAEAVKAPAKKPAARKAKS